MFAIHMAIDIAETTLFLFQMAILSNMIETSMSALIWEDHRIIEMHLHPKNN